MCTAKVLASPPHCRPPLSPVDGPSRREHAGEALSRHTDALQISRFMTVGKKNLYYRKLWLLSLSAIGSIDFCFVFVCVVLFFQ